MPKLFNIENVIPNDRLWIAYHAQFNCLPYYVLGQ